MSEGAYLLWLGVALFLNNVLWFVSLFRWIRTGV